MVCISDVGGTPSETIIIIELRDDAYVQHEGLCMSSWPRTMCVDFSDNHGCTVISFNLPRKA